MLFSIIICNYNNESYVCAAIDSVINQTLNSWELIIIDDKSEDNSIKKINKYSGDIRIKVIKNKINQGYIKSLEKGINNAKCDVVCILDSDDIIEKNTLEILDDVYSKKPEVGFVYTQCYYCNENLKPVHFGFSAQIPEGKTNLQVNSVVALRTFRKSVYLRTEGYDNNCLYAEDIDLTLKMEEVTKLHFINKPLYFYRILPKSQTYSFKNTQINRSSTALAKLNAYKRRLETKIPNLNKAEIAEVLFFGIFTSILARRFKLTLRFIKELMLIHPLFSLDYKFYLNIFKKIKKIAILKKEKPLLKI